MRFEETPLSGAFLVHTDIHEDERGFFARMRCSEEFAEQGLPPDFVQTNISFNRSAGTFRGLHFQLAPSKEGKLVRCLNGEIYDIIVDLRPHSNSFLAHEWFRLVADSLTGLFVPPGFAHGFLTVTENATVLYEMTDYYMPALSSGIRWNDPALGISLPGEIKIINDRDSTYADLDIVKLRRSNGSAL